MINSQKGIMTVVLPVLLIVVMAGAYLGYRVFSEKTNNPGEEVQEMMNPEEKEEMMEDSGMMEGQESMMGDKDSMMDGGGMMAQTKEFIVSGTPFKFSASEIRVKKGDTVRIVFTNDQGMHDWVVDEFNAKTKVLQAGQSETVEFVADKTGTFEYYCSVGTHRQMGMKGNLIVE